MSNKIIDNIKSLYLSDPTGSQPTALWKVFQMYPDMSGDEEYKDGQLSKFVVKNKDVLVSYYHKDGSPFIDEYSKYSLVLLNDKYYQNSTAQTGVPDKYFKKIFTYTDEINHTVRDDIIVKQVNVESEIEDVKVFINNCYEDISVQKETVQSWTRRSVYDASLWIWIIDKRSHEKIGLGIAELDKSINEGALEWIQIKPKYHGKGYGKELVYELLRRLYGKAEFVTVAGKLEDKHNPAKLYEACGFTGEDVWLVFR